MKKLLAVLSRFQITILALIFLTSCSEKPAIEKVQLKKTVEGRLEGGAFIIMREGTPVKLPLIEVKLFKEAEVKSFIVSNTVMIFSNLVAAESKQIQYEKDMQSMGDSVLSLQKSGEEMAVKFNSHLDSEYAEKNNQIVLDAIKRGSSPEHIAELQASIKEDRAKDEIKEQQRHEKALQDIEEWKNKRQQEREVAQEKSAKVNNNHAMLGLDEKTIQNSFEQLPQPLATIKTDADGKFSFMIPCDEKFVLFASTSRDIGNQTEQYIWLVPVSLNGQTQGSVQLSNDNLLTERLHDSSQELIH